MISLLDMTAGAQRMAQTDPHGWTLTLIAVSTVFCALLILYFIYSCIGKAANSRVPGVKRFRRRRKTSAVPDAETAAAITLALEAEAGGEVNAAIALALHLHFNETVHDAEPGIITIAPRRGGWGQPVNNFRKKPVR